MKATGLCCQQKPRSDVLRLRIGKQWYALQLQQMCYDVCYHVAAPRELEDGMVAVDATEGMDAADVSLQRQAC